MEDWKNLDWARGGQGESEWSAAEIARLRASHAEMQARAVKAEAERDEALTHIARSVAATAETLAMAKEVHRGVAAALAREAKLREALRAARAHLIVDYNADGSIAGVGYDGDALRPLVIGLDAALSDEPRHG